MAYLKEAQQFLTKLPSISLEGVEPLGDHCPSKEQKVTVHSCAFKICTSDHAQPSCFASPGSDHHAVVEQKDLLNPSKCMYTPNSSLLQFAYVDIYDSGGARFQAGLHSDPKEAMGRCDGDSAEDLSLSRSFRDGKKTMPMKEKRKVGRPIAYCGDPESPHLMPAERRRIKRRIANRESARRVRARRQDTIEEMVVTAWQMKDQNMQLVEHATTLENEHMIVLAQLGELERRLQYITMENEKLAGDIYCLRNEISVASVPLPNDIDGHEDQPTKPMVVSSMDCSSNIPMTVGGGAFPMPMH